MNKRVIFDVGHPAQVYQFSNIYKKLTAKGWACLYIAKDKEMTKYLLDHFGFDYIVLSKNRKGLIRKIFGALKDYISFYKIVKQFRPGFVLHRFSLHASHTSNLLKITNIGFSDTEHATSLHKITKPFIDIKFSGNSYNYPLGNNHLFFDGNIELFYLHQNVFKPSCNPHELLKIQKQTPYCVVRFVSWDAHHDVGISRMSLEEKKDLIRFLVDQQYKVFVSSESILPEEFQDYELNIPPEHMHTILKFADLYIGEGGTMASEAAVLNTQAIYTNQLPLMGYLKEAAQFNLLFHVCKPEDVKKIILNLPQANYDGFVDNKIDVTAFMVWFIENYPKSARIMKENPDYQYKFR